MKAIETFLQVLLALFVFFWLMVFVSAFPYPINVIFLADLTLVIIIWYELKEKNERR